jgi:alkyldihydroxyacetonephosphate synthase
MVPRNTPLKPAWIEDPPAAGSYRALFKWGDPARVKHPDQRLVRLLQGQLGLSEAEWRRPAAGAMDAIASIPPSRLAAAHVQALTAIVEAPNASTASMERLRFGVGQSAEEIWQLRAGVLPPAADLVLHPRHREDVIRIVAYCHRENIPIYPCGGGSSVTRGLSPVRGGVSLVLRTHMHRVLRFSETNQTITVEPGLDGPHYEALLNDAPRRLHARRAYTGGHFPQSFEFSTVGGWVAAMGAGQESTYYGDMADLVVALEMVSPSGVLRTREVPASATGPCLKALATGSEGAYGVLVAVTLKIFRHQPANRRRFSFIFGDWDRAVTAVREISQGEFGRPSVLRLSDPEETDTALTLYGVSGTPLERLIRLRGLRPGRRCLLLGRTDGEKGLARHVHRCIRRVCRRQGGVYLGGYPVRRWEHGRFSDPYMREDLNDFGIFIDTLETSVSWEHLAPVYQGVRGYIKSRPRTLCLTHASHFYPQGTNLYFIFIGRMGSLEAFRGFHGGIVERIRTCGGTLSHHHGVGRLLAPWMPAYLGPAGMGVLRALKQHFDPRNIMNPGGTLGLD